jgi:hypothetical protein
MAALVAALALGASSAWAVPGAEIKMFEAEASEYQAGSHPDVYIRFEVSTHASLPKSETGANAIKDAVVELPAGLSADPHSTAQCTASQFALNECPPDSQVGTAHPKVLASDTEGFPIDPNYTPLYNLVPQPGQAGLLAWKTGIVAIPIYTVISGRTGSDYGLTSYTRGITSYIGLTWFEQIMWGVPASPEHDKDRFKEGGGVGVFDPTHGPPEVSNEPERPFFSMPTTCGVPLSATFTSIAYDFVVYKKTIPWPETTGCDQLNFNPSLAAKPSTEAADSASGLDVALKVPQNDSPQTPSDSEIRATTTKLPAGFSINASAADGKTFCSDAQAHLGLDDEAECPEYAKVGTVTLDSSALPGPIKGGIYIAEPKPGARYRIFAIADGFATHIKLPATVETDPLTGQLTTVFENLPQSPFTEFDLHFFGSERGLLATPDQCGTYAVESEFVPWANELENQTSTQFFSITSGPDGQPCPGATRPFAPGLRAVGGSNGAGAHSPFSIYVTREDGNQTLSTIQVNTPPGLTATLKGIPYCPDAALRAIESPSRTGAAEQQAPSCPAASQIGESYASAGAGSRPFTAPGKVYLSGPYKGAPLSLSVVTPIVEGPYDLGNIVNRVALHVDPTSAAITASSDPLPQIVEGIPLRLKSVLINLDRQDFTLNPTNCDPFAVTSLLTGGEGATAAPGMHFQVANCSSLGFEPKLTTRLKGSTKHGGHPALTATLSQEPNGESNISRAVVALPRSEFLDNEHIGTICTRVQFAAESCPAGSVYGRARAISPLLDTPLEGSVYLRSSSHTLPDLVAALKGPASQPIEIDLVGRIDSINEGIRTTFASIPDTPVSKFVLSMRGGKKGLLVNSRNLCKGAGRTNVKLLGQNGDRANQRPRLKAPCKSKARGKRATRKRRGGHR